MFKRFAVSIRAKEKVKVKHFFQMQKIFFLFLMLLTVQTFGQVRKYSNEFLNIGVGARALAMEKSVTASVDNAGAGYWNPALLQHLPEKYNAAAMHAEYFAGIAQYDHLGIAYKMNDSSALALNILRLGVDKIPNTLNIRDKNGIFDLSKIRYFSVADYAFLLSYSGQLPRLKHLNYGASVKLIYRNLGEFASAYGFGFDISAIYQMKNWTFAGVLRDVSSTFNAWVYNRTAATDSLWQATDNELPSNGLEITAPSAILGVSYRLAIGKQFNLLAESDITFTFDGKRNIPLTSSWLSAQPNFGLELNYKKMLYLRGGIGDWTSVPDFDGKKKITFKPALGLGLRLFRIHIDYALSDIAGQTLLYTHIFSLSYRFNTFSRK